MALHHNSRSDQRITVFSLTTATAVLAVLTLIALVLTYTPALRQCQPAGTDELSSQAITSTLATITQHPQRLSVIGYERTHFGAGWARLPGQRGSCSSREAIITAQWPAHIEPGTCRLVGSPAPDPYSGEITELGDIEVDHIFPLSAAWDFGAHDWSMAERIAFANDPLNLIAVSKTANQAKSDLLPGEWMPPDKSVHCWYSIRVAQVAVRYELGLARDDMATMKSSCRLMPDFFQPNTLEITDSRPISRLA